MTIQTKSFVFTNWNVVDFDYEALLNNRQVRYIAFELETCPGTGKLHHQGFMFTHNKHSTGGKSLGKIGNWFKQKEGHVHAHIEPMRGSLLENEAYCSKVTGGVLTEFGDKPSPGARHDLEAVVRQIRDEEVTVDELALTTPSMVHQYGRTLDRVQTIVLRNKWRTWMTEGVWIVGPSGSGKSHSAFTDFHPSTHYVKNLNEEWWDGYVGQPIVLLNEFRGQIPFSELLDLVDKWPKTVKQRNREPVPFLAHKVIITSIFHPSNVYRRQDRDEPWEQFSRRFTIEELEPRAPKLM